MFRVCVLLAKEAKAELHSFEQECGGEAETSKLSWFNGFWSEVCCLKAESHYALGNLLGCLVEVDEVIDAPELVRDTLDPFVLARCFQLRGHIMVLVGADSLCTADLDRALTVLEDHNIILPSSGKISGWSPSDTVQAEAAQAEAPLLPPVPDMQISFTAADWHRTRRKLILQLHPEVREMHELRSGAPGDGAKLAVLLMSMTIAQLLLVCQIGQWGSLSAVVLGASTVGAFLAYGFQAVNHDLSHVTRHKGESYVVMLLASALCNFPWAMYYQNYHAIHHAYTGSDLDRDGDILFQPWHSPPCIKVSRVNGTALHKQKPPTHLDILGWRVRLSRWSEIFDDDDEADEEVHERKNEKGEIEADSSNGAGQGNQQQGQLRAQGETEEVTIDVAASPWSRFAWSIVAPWLLYVLFSVRKLQLDHAHRAKVEYEGLMLAANLFCLKLGGVYGVIYLWLSAVFSLGGFCHPYFGFWLIQHQNSMRKVRLDSAALKQRYGRAFEVSALVRAHPQPTVSYYGSWLWNVANFGELLHVEHHDFPVIPAARYPRLHELAPEFYDTLLSRDSVFKVIWEWLTTKSDEVWMRAHGDFARRDAYIDDLWLHQYQFPLDTPETAEDLKARILHQGNASEPTCAGCHQRFAANEWTLAGHPMIRAALVRSCPCLRVAHLACAEAARRLPCSNCNREPLPLSPSPPSSPQVVQILAHHVHGCLRGSPCAQCCQAVAAHALELSSERARVLAT